MEKSEGARTMRIPQESESVRVLSPPNVVRQISREHCCHKLLQQVGE